MNYAKFAFEVLKISLPVMVAYVPLGMAFGILAASNDFSLAQILAISFFVYSGTAEFLLVPFIVAGESLLGIFVTIFLLGFRHFFYTLSLLKLIKSLNLYKIYVIFALTDESFALLSSKEKELLNLNKNLRSFFCVFLCALLQFYWILGGALGFIFQKSVKIDYSGVEFALNALFIVLAFDAYKQNPKLKILIIASIIGLCGLLFIAKAYMLFACLGFGLTLLILGKKYV